MQLKHDVGFIRGKEGDQNERWIDSRNEVVVLYFLDVGCNLMARRKNIYSESYGMELWA